MILDFIEHYPDSVEKACGALSEQFKNGSLAVQLVAALTDCNDKLNEARKGRLSPSTVRKWQALKAKTGHCLPAKTRVKTDWNTVWWLPLFLASYRKPQKPNVTEAYADFAFDWREQGLDDSERPSYGIVNRILNSMPKLIRETGRCTGSELAALKSFIRRDWSGPSNEVWVGDGHTFKAKVKHPITGKAFAPEVTVIIDASSRFIVGWAFSLSENQIAVSEALGKGMLKHGKPLIYYSDNGSGQTAKTIDCPAGGMLARLGVRHETGIPGNPQGRGLIEGLWDITAIAVAKTFVTFQGTGMDSGALRKVTQAINSAKTKGEVPDFVPSWQEFMDACEARFDWYNHNHQHRSLGGKTPAAVYFANFDPSWACALTEHEIINLYRPFVLRRPFRGEVKWLNNVYHHKALDQLPEKVKVRVAFDLHDAKQVWISDLDGRFICIAGFESNSVKGFPTSLKEQLQEQRLQGIEKLAQAKMNHAREEMGYVIEGEVLQAVPVIPREVEEPLKAPVLEPAFNKQDAVDETPTQTYQELVLSLQKKTND
jgi:putative transposase